MTTYLAIWTAGWSPSDEKVDSILSALDCQGLANVGSFKDDSWSAHRAGLNLIDARAKYWSQWNGCDAKDTKSVVSFLVEAHEAGLAAHASIGLSVTQQLYQEAVEAEHDFDDKYPFLCHSCDLLLGTHLFDAYSGEYFGIASIALVFRGRGYVSEASVRETRARILAWPAITELCGTVEAEVGAVTIDMWWELAQWADDSDSAKH